MVSVLRVAGFGAATRMTVTLRWVGDNCWLNLQANPTTLLTGTNAFAADTGLEGERELLFLFLYPFRLLRQILRTIDRSFVFTARSIQDHLVILTIAETCKERGGDFLDFLLEDNEHRFSLMSGRHASKKEANMNAALATSSGPG